MSEPLVRRFIFKTENDWKLFKAFIRAHWAPLKAQGLWLQVVVSIYKSKRSVEQNSYMWGDGLLGTIAKQALANGQRLTPEGWNMVFKILFLPDLNAKGMDKWFIDPITHEKTLSMSTSDLNEQEMNHYLTQVAEYATHDLGVRLPVNPKDL